MLVRQLAGRLAGELIELEHATAMACLKGGTALPGDAEWPPRKSGRKTKGKGDGADAPAPGLLGGEVDPGTSAALA